ncbi:hypothetical protein Q7P36_006897 [Cladosporium allicinum]
MSCCQSVRRLPVHQARAVKLHRRAVTIMGGAANTTAQGSRNHAWTKQHLRLATGAAANTCEMNRTLCSLHPSKFHRRTGTSKSSFRGVNNRPDWAIGCNDVGPAQGRACGEREADGGQSRFTAHLQRIEVQVRNAAQILYSQTVMHRR